MNKTTFCRYLICLVSCCICFRQAVAQNTALNESDGLSLPRKVSGIVDTNYIHSLVRLSKQIQNRNADSAILLSKLAVSYSIASGYNTGAANALLCLSAQLFNYKKAIDECKAYDRYALFFAQQATSSKGLLIAMCYADIAGPYYVEQKMDSMVYYCHRALKTMEQYQVQDTGMFMSLYSNLSTAYNANNEPQKAIYYLKKARLLGEAWSPEKAGALIKVYANIASSFYHLKQYDSVIAYSRKGLDLIEAHPGSNSVRAKGTLLYCLGLAYYELDDQDNAIRMYQEALKQEQQIPTHGGATNAYYGLALSYCEQQQWSKAEDAAMKTIATADENHLAPASYVGIYDFLAKLYSELYRGHIDYAKAYHYKDLSAAIRDSMQNKEKLEMTNRLDVAYRTAEKDKEIAQKQQQLTKRSAELQQKNYWIGGISLASLLLILILGLVYKNNKQKQKLQMERMNALQQEHEISNLKHVIAGEEKERTRLARELHDGIMVLFSAIKMKLRSLATEHSDLKNSQDFTDINKQYEYAIKELRRTAHNLMPDMLLEGGLPDAVFYFCKSVQDTSNIQISFQHYGDMPRLQEEFELSIYRIIQELIQNIIKHAKASKALVQINYLNDVLCITVEDNGIGFGEKQPGQTEGMGLRSIRTRIRALNGMMDIKTSADRGTTVYMEFDIRSVIKTNTIDHAY